MLSMPYKLMDIPNNLSLTPLDQKTQQNQLKIQNQKATVYFRIFKVHWSLLKRGSLANLGLKPYRMIGNLFPKPKDKISKGQVRGLAYSIPCTNCSKSYVGETKHKFGTRLKEHKKAVETKQAQKSALAEHYIRSGHETSWDSVVILRKNNNWHNRHVVEG